MPELKDSSDLRSQIIAETQQYLSLPPEGDEFTIYHLMEWQDIDINSARVIIKKMTEEGKLSKRKGKANGGSCNIYKMIE